MITRVKTSYCQHKNCRKPITEGLLIEDNTGKEICVCIDCFRKIQERLKEEGGYNR